LILFISEVMLPSDFHEQYYKFILVRDEKQLKISHIED